jgi:hypothetical protein
MGGPGSGSHYHWWRDGKKDVVESCRHLDAGRWMREGILKPGSWQAGVWTWFRDAERASSLEYEVDTRGELPWLRLAYALTATGERVDYRIRLTTTRPTSAGCAGGSSARWPSTGWRAAAGWGSSTSRAGTSAAGAARTSPTPAVRSGTGGWTACSRTRVPSTPCWPATPASRNSGSPSRR